MVITLNSIIEPGASNKYIEGGYLLDIAGEPAPVFARWDQVIPPLNGATYFDKAENDAKKIDIGADVSDISPSKLNFKNKVKLINKLAAEAPIHDSPPIMKKASKRRWFNNILYQAHNRKNYNY